MEKIIKARFLEGVFRPIEAVELEEGKEVIVTIKENPEEKKDLFESAIGGWRGKIDCEKLIKDIYETRKISVKRPEVKL
jgi:predicted DNA-binding antitoxin AbrB/MazE fold protein